MQIFFFSSRNLGNDLKFLFLIKVTLTVLLDWWWLKQFICKKNINEGSLHQTTANFFEFTSGYFQKSIEETGSEWLLVLV